MPEAGWGGESARWPRGAHFLGCLEGAAVSSPAEALVLGVLEEGPGWGWGALGFSGWCGDGERGNGAPRRGTAHTPYVTVSSLPRLPGMTAGGREGACRGAAEGLPGCRAWPGPPCRPPAPLLARCWQDLDVRTMGLLSHPGPSGEQLGALGGGGSQLPSAPLLPPKGGGVLLCCSGVPLLSPLLPDARPPNASLLPLGCGVPRLPCDRPRPRGQPSRPVSGGEGAAGSSCG